MNDVQALIDRQLGLPYQAGYDSVLRRLVVREAESFYGLGAPGADDPPIFACRFAEAAGLEHILALANEDGRVAIQNTSKTDCEGSLEGFQCHNNAVFDLAWRPGHMNFVTVSGDHTACLWDVSEGAPRRVQVFSSHTRSVKTAVFRPGEPCVFATGARDGNILVWDTRDAQQPAGAVLRPDRALRGCHAGAGTPPGGKRPRPDSRAVSVTALAFQTERALLSAGECDGNIKMWDLRKTYSAHTREPLPARAIPYCGASSRRGYTHLAVDSSGVRLYASCMDDVIYCFNVATYNPLPEQRYVGHENATFYIKTSLSPDCRYLVSGSSDKHAYIWNVKRSQPVVRLAGHWAEVTCAAWARSAAPMLVTCSDDARHKLWRVSSNDDSESIGLQGTAEIAPPASPPPARWGNTERTPASRNTPRAATPRPMNRRGKRCLADLLNAAREAETSQAKVPKVDPEQSQPKRQKTENEPSGTSKRPLEDDVLPSEVGFTTPTKRPRREALSPRSPNTLSTLEKSPSVSPNTRVRLFTSSLPDWVATGEAPHLRLMSPIKRKLDTPDWLTLLSRKRSLVAPSTSPSPNPAPSSPAEAPTRRSSTSERTPKSTSKGKTLLKYFNVINKDKV